MTNLNRKNPNEAAISKNLVENWLQVEKFHLVNRDREEP